MKVYPVNAIEAGNPVSYQIAPYDIYDSLYNKYIEYKVDFTSPDVEINCKWDSEISADAFITGNTNALSGNIVLFNNGDEIYNEPFDMENLYIKIVEFDQMEHFDSMKLTLHGNENIYIGYLFIGDTWNLPRFTVMPSAQMQMRNESGRTFSGQVTGIPAHTLKTFGCSFSRIKNKEVKIIEDYVNGVQSVIPHIIDPYYEAHDEFEPMFATLVEYSEKEKRAENGFYWNFSMKWQEAR